MDNILKDYLHSLKYGDDDIAELIIQAPMLDSITAAEAYENISLVISAGYPESDIDGIISINPNFLCKNAETLAENIAKVLETADNFEDAIKNDPFLL